MLGGEKIKGHHVLENDLMGRGCTENTDDLVLKANTADMIVTQGSEW